ncbi:hypothetical protein BDZ89DRAFT_303612 [Hymenopellis radicata]|nr:hypothetical protein BDZ89DRAFT_303612 [Hymenopellis radicata]
MSRRVMAQGIEVQRRWIREVKIRVEEERGGRLAKLDQLSSELKRLERIALDNSTYLDENIFRTLVPGSNVLSVLARAEYYMNEKDLSSAAARGS